MVKHTTKTPSILAEDILAFLMAAGYLQSVLTAAHHVSMWVHDGSGRIVEAPAVPVLLISLALCGYSWYKLRKPSMLVVVTLTILATSSVFWLSGLRTNFYF